MLVSMLEGILPTGAKKREDFIPYSKLNIPVATPRAL